MKTPALDDVRLDEALPRDRYKSRMEQLERKLSALQQEARTAGLPVAIVFEGWDAAGKGTMINRLSLALDARGFRVHPTNAPTEEEILRPYLWRFWLNTPARGRIAVFDRSWYGRVLVARVHRLVNKQCWRQAYEDIRVFERQLADDGCVLVKFFLHIAKAEQQRRFKKLLKNPATAWKVTDEDWAHHRRYKSYAKAVDDMLEETHRPHAPWTVIPARDRRLAAVRIFEAVIRAVEKGLRARVKKGSSRAPALRPARRTSPLRDVDLSVSLDRPAYEKKLDALQERVRELEHEIYVRRVPVVIAYEGWDAAGKGGNMRRLVQGLDPRGYEVIPIAAPTEEEKAHHYLWRFWRPLPKAGHITIFDRTWYGRVLVERVEGFCTEAAWKRAYHEINETERQWADFGIALIKFWLEISPAEQLKRFKARERTPHKRWKITEEDWRNRKKWDAYREAVDDMLFYTDTDWAPWTVIESNCKLHARIKVLQTVVDRLDARV